MMEGHGRVDKGDSTRKPLSSSSPSHSPSSSYFPILLVNFIGTMGFSIVLPFLVFLVTDFGGNAIVYGLLAATYPAFQLIS
jgi:DHA1 family tetracycline resistance protein-like MFS transporter